MARTLAAWLLTSILWVPAAHAADRVVLRDGSAIEGRVVLDTPAKLVVLQGTREREIATADVKDVRSVERSLARLLDRWVDTPADSAVARLEIARVARASELEGEARLFALGALLVDPDLAAAHEFLGHEQRRGAWFEREDKRTYACKDGDVVHADFKDAWRFSTLHFDLRTNLPLARAFEAALELELAYRAFFERFRGELALRDIATRLPVQIHADRLSYPGSSDRAGYFDPLVNTFFQDASNGLSLGTLAHETTHQLLHNTAERTRAATGSIPAWVHEGLAGLIGEARHGLPGRATYDLAARSPLQFQLHGTAKKPYDLPRMLTLHTSDFQTSQHSGLVYAQAYTLVHYALNGAGGRHRAGFFEFLRRCYAGRSSVTDFKDALDVREGPFEAEWHAYARGGS